MNLVQLSEVCKIVNGGTPKSGVAAYWGGDVAWLTPAEMGKLDVPEIAKTARTITVAGLKNSSAKQVPVGSVIMSTRAPIGHLAIPLAPMAFNQGCRGLMPGDRLATRYLYYLLWFSREALNDLGTGTTFKELSTGALASYKIPLPPLEEQRRIVAVLDQGFAAIGTATANAEKNLGNARKLFRGAIDEHFAAGRWPSHQLARLTAMFDDGDWIESKDQSPSGIRLIQTGNVGDGYFKDRTEKARYISDATFKRLRCTEILPGDCLVSRLPDPVGRACIIPDTGERMITAVDCTIVRFKPSTLLAELFCYYSQSSDYAAQIAKQTTGATRLRISRSNLGAIRVPVPPVSHQDALLAQLNELAELVASLEETQRQKLEELTRLKQSLLQRAFTGELLAKTHSASAANDNYKTPMFAAQLLAIAFARHASHNRERTFGTVKAQKTLHMVEAVGGIDIGRQPLRAAAGPDDANHRHAVLDWAKENGFFEFRQRTGGGHGFCRMANYDAMIGPAEAAVNAAGSSVIRSIDLLIGMDTEFAELVATTHAAWNNLLHDRRQSDPASIVKSARDDWHVRKERFDESRFHDAIRFIEKQGIVPDGSAKYVGGQESLAL